MRFASNIRPVLGQSRATLRPLGHNLLERLVEWWPLNEQSGTRRGVHAGLHLTDNNTVTGADGVGSLASQFTAANTEFLNRASSSQLQTGDIDFTLSAWVYLTNKTLNRCIVSKYNVTLNSATELEFYTDHVASLDRFRFQLTSNGQTGGTVTATANNFGAPALDTWYLLFFWHDAAANTISIQVNTSTPDSAAIANGAPAAGSDFRIGNWENGATHRLWDGRIQRVGFWKRILSADERAWLYNGGRGRDYPFF